MLLFSHCGAHTENTGARATK